MRRIGLTLLITACLTAATAARGAVRPDPQDDIFQDPERMIRALYEAVTFPTGTTDPDWDRVRSFFHPEVVFCMRQTRETMVVIDLDEFIAWFARDFVQQRFTERGFEETVQNLKLTVFGGMAQCWVVYRASYMTPDARGQLGLDNHGLVYDQGRWWIASITNDVVTAERPLPDFLRGDG